MNLPKIDASHVLLFLVVVLTLVGRVVLAAYNKDAPAVLDLVLTAGAGAMFGVTLPAKGGATTE